MIGIQTRLLIKCTDSRGKKEKEKIDGQENIDKKAIFKGTALFGHQYKKGKRNMEGEQGKQ